MKPKHNSKLIFDIPCETERECVNCGNKSDVYYIERLDNYFCEDCYSEEDVESDYNTERKENQKEINMSGWVD